MFRYAAPDGGTFTDTLSADAPIFRVYLRVYLRVYPRVYLGIAYISARSDKSLYSTTFLIILSPSHHSKFIRMVLCRFTLHSTQKNLHGGERS